MGICEILTIIFVVAKLLGVIDWEWLYVFLPEIIAFVLYIALLLVHFFGRCRINKNFEKKWKDLL